MDWRKFLFKDIELNNFADAVKYLMNQLVESRPEFGLLLDALVENNEIKANEIFSKLEVKPLVQISNMKIPHIVANMFDELSIDDFRHINIDKFLSLKVNYS